MKKKWFTNGLEDKLCDNCPEGFRPGRCKKPDQRSFKHFTNGIKNIFCDPADCPSDFYPGITTYKNRDLSSWPKDRKHFTNGITNVFCAEEDCPEGFYPGCTRHKKVTKKQKDSLDDLLSVIDKNTFESLYRNFPDVQVAEKLNITGHFVRRLAKHFNLIRTAEDKKSAMTKKVIKTQSTWLKKYGVDNPNKSETIKEKNKENFRQKYGIDKGGRALSLIRSDCSEELKQMIFDKDKSVTFLEAHNKEFTKEDLMERFKCNVNTFNAWIYKYQLQDYIKQSLSHYEDEIAQLFPTVNFKQHERKVLPNREIDLYAPDFKIGIEFNGTYWHSALYVEKDYHLSKSKLAEENGIRLFHIYEYEWIDPVMREKIIQTLNIAFNINTNKIYARNCIIKQITNKEAKALNEKIHLQGHRNAQITYGLFYNDELVQLMSFSKTKYNRNLKSDNSWEIIRGCPGSNNIVVGGVSKLFKHFIRDYDPDEIFSYCDFNKFDGRSYETIGMKFIGYTGPDMKWILKGMQVVNRQPSRHSEFKKEAYSTIHGAGSKKYLWKKGSV